MDARRPLPFLVLALVLATAALAASVHFTVGPTFTSDGSALTACGSLAGLGNQDVTIVLKATATTQCVNRGGNPPPGQRSTATGSVSHLSPKNGSLTFCVSTDPVPNPCVKPMTPVTTFSGAQLTVYQNGRVVFP